MEDDKRMSIFDEEDKSAPGGAAEAQGEVPAVEPEPESSDELEAGASEPEAPAEVSPPDASQEQGRHNVPITVVLDEREKRQAAEKRAEEVERQLAQIRREQQARQQQTPPPDVFSDPDARFQYEREQIARQQWSQKLDTSEMLARQAFGDAVVEEAQVAFMNAASQDPSLGLRLQSQRHPYDFVVKWHKREKFLAEVGDDPDAYKARILAEAQQQQTQPAVQAQAKAPPASLASAPSAGTSEPPPSYGTRALPSLFG